MTTYKDAGVDIEKADLFVNHIARAAKWTMRPQVLESAGSFGALFDLSALPITDYKAPILVTSTDGVGTKLEIARELDVFDTIGIDLVAMIANDIVVSGAEPMIFLDYYATGKLDIKTSELLIDGIVEGCKQAKMSLVAGETAEMPGVYEEGRFDLAGFGVGLVEKAELLPKKDLMKEGDFLIGLPSSGLHSNGFSLVRKLIADGKLELTSELLTPTKIYVDDILAVKHLIKGAAHITGGGQNNIPRMLPKTLQPRINRNIWTVLDIFKEIQEAAQCAYIDMFNTFNCGIGIVVVVDPNNTEEFYRICPDSRTIGVLINA